MLRDVKRGLVEMVTADRQVRKQTESVCENAFRLERQIEQAVNRGRRVLFLLALKRRCAAVLRLQSSRAPGTVPAPTRKIHKRPYQEGRIMGMLSRMSTIVKSKMNRILDNAEDPRETLDYSYEKQLEMLRNVKRGVVEMVAAKRQIVQQADKVRENIARLERQAEQALDAGREDLALMALERKNTAATELQGLDEQIAGMEVEQEKLTQAEARLSAKVAAFRTKKEVIKAQYTAAQAQVRIGSALSGISEEMGDVGLAVERAENKTSSMKARASAIDELAEAGVLSDFTGESKDDITRELEKMSASSGAQSELEALKARRAAPAQEQGSSQ